MQPFASVEHEDAFLLFRALCKLSQRPDHAGPGDGLAVAPTAEEARQMESKAVSLVSFSSAHRACNLLRVWSLFFSFLETKKSKMSTTRKEYKLRYQRLKYVGISTSFW